MPKTDFRVPGITSISADTHKVCGDAKKTLYVFIYILICLFSEFVCEQEIVVFSSSGKHVYLPDCTKEAIQIVADKY